MDRPLTAPITNEAVEDAQSAIVDNAPADLGRAAAGGAAWSVIAVLANRLLATVVFVILSRLLAPSEFGVVALASVTVVILQAIAESGVGRALVRLPVLTRADIDTAFWAGTAWSITLTVLLVALSKPLADLFGDPQAAPILAAMSACLLLSGLQSVQLGLLSRNMQFRQISVREVAGAAGGSVCGILLALLGCGAWALVGQLITSQLFSVAALWFVSDWRPGRHFERKRLKPLLHAGTAFAMTSVSGTLQRNMDNLIVGTFLGVLALGYYSVAYRFFLLMCSLTVDATAIIGLPTFAKLAADRQRMIAAFYRAVNLACRITFPVFVYLAIDGATLITRTSGSNWAPAGRILVALCPAAIILAITTFDAAVLFANGQLRMLMVLTGLTAAVTVGAFLVGVQFGAVGVAAGYAAGLFIMWPLRIYLLRRCTDLRLRPYLGQILVSVLLCAPLGAVLIALQAGHLLGNGWVHLIFAACLGAAIYIAVIFLADRPTLHILTSIVASALPGRLRKAFRLDRVVTSSIGSDS